MSATCVYNFKSITVVLSKKAPVENKKKIFNLKYLFLYGPTFSGNGLDLTKYKSYICAEFQDDWIIFTLVIACNNENAIFLK